ncbi:MULTISPECIES: hypothetical protein [unclassified Cedecea]
MMTHTPETLKTMLPSEFEDIRASAEAHRHVLTSAAMHVEMDDSPDEE